jgi:hypothetical protein
MQKTGIVCTGAQLKTVSSMSRVRRYFCLLVGVAVLLILGAIYQCFDYYARSPRSCLLMVSIEDTYCLAVSFLSVYMLQEVKLPAYYSTNRYI